MAASASCHPTSHGLAKATCPILTPPPISSHSAHTHIVAIYLAQGNKMSIISHLIYRFPFCVKGRKLFQAAGQGRAKKQVAKNAKESFYVNNWARLCGKGVI